MMIIVYNYADGADVLNFGTKFLVYIYIFITPITMVYDIYNYV